MQRPAAARQRSGRGRLKGGAKPNAAGARSARPLDVPFPRSKGGAAQPPRGDVLYRMAIGFTIAWTPPVIRLAPSTNMNSQALSFTSSAVSTFSRM